MTASGDVKWTERWLSEPRFSPYLSVCDGNSDLALALYQWNIGFSQSILGDIAIFEVALRNSYNNVMSNSFTGSKHWLLDSTSPVRRKILRKSNGKEVDKNETNNRLIGEAEQQKGSDPDDIIAALSLGFWVHLTNKSHESDVWIPHIHKAWPKGTNRSDIHARLDAVNKLRNRIAHHEKLFNKKVSGKLPSEIASDVPVLLKELDTEIFNRLSESNGIGFSSKYIKQNPCPVDTPF